jgi:hypothetical protein
MRRSVTRWNAAFMRQKGCQRKFVVRPLRSETPHSACSRGEQRRTRWTWRCNQRLGIQHSIPPIFRIPFATMKHATVRFRTSPDEPGEFKNRRKSRSRRGNKADRRRAEAALWRVAKAEVFFAPKSASYSENEIRGNARPHPGPLPQEREKRAQRPGIFMLCGAALPHGGLRRLLRIHAAR